MRFNFEDKICFTKAVYYNFHQIPLPRPFKDGTGGMGNFAPEKGCIELYDKEGCCAHLSIGPAFVTDILPMILTGETKSFNEWRESLYWRVRNAGFQSEKAVEVGQLDLMMLDLLAQRAGKPLHRFLGATKDWAAAYKGGGSLLLEDEELVADMVRYVEEGYKTVKFKVGSDDGTNMERDIRRLKKVREAVGDKIGIAVDANQRWSVDDAYRFAKMAEPYQLEWLEEPIHSNDFNGIRRLKDMGISMPLAFGESMRISYMYEIYLEKGVEHLQPSIGRMTRMDDLLTIRDLAREHGAVFSSGGRIYLNAVMGCLYGEDERVEFHEPITVPVGAYTMYKPKEEQGRIICDQGIAGIAPRMDVEKLEKDGLMESRQIFYAPKV